jgi:chain length determinant protein tyrosine kinase EpsG
MRTSELISLQAANATLSGASRSIGAVLVEAGRLSSEDAQAIVQLQHEKGLRFGDAGKELGFLTQGDIDFALARQFEYPYLIRGESGVSEEVIAAYDPFSTQAESMRALRAQLMVRWFDKEPAHKALAIISAARHEGRSFIAANLAVVFSQLGERTLLIDADLRQPRQHQLFGLDNRSGLSALLSGRAGPETVHKIPSLAHLSVLPAGALPPNPQELLARPLFDLLLHQFSSQFEVILVDSPAAAESADAQTIAVRAAAALVVVRKNASRVWRVQGVSDSVVQGKATIVGAVLNDF